MRRWGLFVVTGGCLLLPVISYAQDPLPNLSGESRPSVSRRYVPDETTAISIAEAILRPLIGEESVIAMRPYKARLDDAVWVVSSTLPRGGLLVMGMEVRINADTSEIISAYFTP